MSDRGGRGGDSDAEMRERNLAALDQLVAPGRRGAPGHAFPEAARPLARAVLGRLAWDGRLDFDDLVQECLVAAWRSAGNLRDVGAWRAWVAQIAVHVYRRWRTRQFRHQRKVEAARREPEHLFQQDPIRPDRAAESRELLCKSLEALRPDLRDTVILDAEGLSAAEIAAALGIAEGTVWSRLHGARRQVRSEFGDSLAGKPPGSGFSGACGREDGDGETPEGEGE